MDTIKICCAGGPGVHTADCQYYEKKQKTCPECHIHIDDSQSYCSDSCRGDFYETRYDALATFLRKRFESHLAHRTSCGRKGYSEAANMYEIQADEINAVLEFVDGQ